MCAVYAFTAVKLCGVMFAARTFTLRFVMHCLLSWGLAHVSVCVT
jgi:hypothetical protein